MDKLQMHYNNNYYYMIVNLVENEQDSNIDFVNIFVDFVNTFVDFVNEIVDFVNIFVDQYYSYFDNYCKDPLYSMIK
jgi:hypothetical protein